VTKNAFEGAYPRFRLGSKLGQFVDGRTQQIIDERINTHPVGMYLVPCFCEDTSPFLCAYIRRHVFADAIRFQASQDVVQDFAAVIAKHAVSKSSFFHELLKLADIKSGGLLLRSGLRVIRVAHRVSIYNRYCVDYPNWDGRGIRFIMRRGLAQLLDQRALCEFLDQEVNEAPDLERQIPTLWIHGIDR
jgi:hypothetical protein